jgi:hypothetical protein
MKKIYLPIFVLLLAAACKKENTAKKSSSGTIINTQEQIMATVGQKFSGTVYSEQDSITVAGLMKANNLSTDGLSFYEYQAYNALDQDNKMAYFQVTSAMQVRNSLPVFFEDIHLGFENGKLNGPYPAPQFIVGDITLDNKPKLALTVLRTAFIKLDDEKEAQHISIGDSTLVAQLGYYNLNISHWADGGAPNYIKAWYIHPQHSNWPNAYYRDDDGSVLGFQPLTKSGPVAP